MFFFVGTTYYSNNGTVLVMMEQRQYSQHVHEVVNRMQSNNQTIFQQSRNETSASRFVHITYTKS